jgi:hypothetical protein
LGCIRHNIQWNNSNKIRWSNKFRTTAVHIITIITTIINIYINSYRTWTLFLNNWNVYYLFLLLLWMNIICITQFDTCYKLGIIVPLAQNFWGSSNIFINILLSIK